VSTWESEWRPLVRDRGAHEEIKSLNYTEGDSGNNTKRRHHMKMGKNTFGGGSSQKKLHTQPSLD